MQIQLVIKTIGLLLMIFSVTQLPPILVDWIYQESERNSFLLSFFASLITGFVLWFLTKNNKKDFRVREGILVVVLFWIILSLFGSIPFLFFNLSMSNAFFESISALTTTGATVLTNLDDMPKALLYYRQQLQWLGGMGIIVLAIAILPMLGIGGLQLYNMEKKGVNDSKLMPKITQTAKMLWLIYVGLTVLAALFFYIAGMSFFDAIAHSFSTIATGGFSTHDSSIGFYNSQLIESVAIVFMFLAGINFSLHFFAFRDKSLLSYFKDSEFKAYLSFLLISFVIVVILLLSQNYYPTLSQTIRHSLFQVVSIVTSTGFISQDFSLWPTILPVLLIFLSFVGASTGSTSGGMKVVRILLLLKQGMNEIKHLIHPNICNAVKLGNKIVPERTMISIWGFFSLYVFSFIIIMIALMITGLDQVTAFSATATSINNLGPGLGVVALNYESINDTAKWILSFSMLLGRLEIITLIALFHRAFWRF
ncbi:Potassium uptake protein TrkH [hydrothermal vent metagenome]|uniref:Potassium uptake protein TrkH n=1 Tax=hydrothermal vent metagenome TaxID=652676 RepID=A0A1W1CSK3_9ZZZZ